MLGQDIYYTFRKMGLIGFTGKPSFCDVHQNH